MGVLGGRDGDLCLCLPCYAVQDKMQTIPLNSAFYLISYPISPTRKPVYVHEVSGRFDVGNLPSYIECDTFFKENLSGVKSYMQ